MTTTNTAKKKRGQTSRQRTIAPELLDQWQRLRRSGDSELIAAKLHLSKGVIDNALIYGHVCRQETIDGINEFFRDRLMGEVKAANELRDLASGNKPAA